MAPATFAAAFAAPVVASPVVGSVPAFATPAAFAAPVVASPVVGSVPAFASRGAPSPVVVAVQALATALVAVLPVLLPETLVVARTVVAGVAETAVAVAFARRLSLSFTAVALAVALASSPQPQPPYVSAGLRRGFLLWYPLPPSAPLSQLW